MPHKLTGAGASSADDIISREEALQDLPVDEVLEEGSLSGPPLKSRRDARELVIKIIYSAELSGDSLRDAGRDLLPESPDKYTRFAADLCERIRNGADEIDRLIVKHSEKWDLNRIAILDKLILRMAIAEILFFPDIPPKVTINEAIEIAKKYSTVNSGRFVNGILDAVFNDLRDKLNKQSGSPTKSRISKKRKG